MPIIDVNGVSLHHRFDGPDNGPVVLLGNSLATDLRMWDPQVPDLTGAGFRVLRYDRRGHGQSSVPAGPYTLEQLAQDAVGLLDALGIEKAHFCGLSIGGMVGQILGTEHAGKFHSLALCDTSAHMPAPETWDERINAVRAGGMAAVVDATLDRWITKGGQQRLPQVAQLVREMILGTPVEGFCGCAAAIQKLDNRSRLGRIKLPTTVIVGKEDQGTPVAANQYIHEQIAGSTFTVLDEAAHLANLEQPEAFNEALLGHLEANR